jgi:multicomponent Na+:H+ antiporter subunit G
MTDVVAATLILGGVSLSVLAGVAILRMPDALARANAATKAAGLGLASILAGTAIAIGTTEAYVKLGIAIVLQFITAPVAGHVLGRAAYRSGTVTSRDFTVDDLAPAPHLDPVTDDERPPPRDGA